MGVPWSQVLLDQYLGPIAEKVPELIRRVHVGAGGSEQVEPGSVEERYLVRKAGTGGSDFDYPTFDQEVTEHVMNRDSKRPRLEGYLTVTSDINQLQRASPDATVIEPLPHLTELTAVDEVGGQNTSVGRVLPRFPQMFGGPQLIPRRVGTRAQANGGDGGI